MSDRKLRIIVDQSGDAGPGLDSLVSGLGKLGGFAATAATGGLLLLTGGVVALGKGLFDSVGAASEAQLGQAELQAVLESTNGAAGMTADAVNALASKYQSLTMFEDDAILSGQNMLLTFTNIGKDVFPMATEAMLNMGQKMGDIGGASVMLGKALQDPVAGVTALRRVGVALTEAQELQIQKFVEMGDIASAQKVILGELETEFGGLAVAAGETLPGKMAILQHTFGDIQETIGAAFLPALMSVADQLAAGLNSPQGQLALTGITNFITTSAVPAIDQIMAFVGRATTMFMTWSSHLNETTRPAMLLIRNALDRISIATGGATGKFSLSKAALGILKGVLTATTTAIKVIAIAFQVAATYVEIWSSILTTAKGIVNGFKSTVSSMASSVQSAINSIIGAWNSLISVMQAAANAIPDVLTPGSLTPFEIGLRGIANAAGQVGQTLAPAFSGLPSGGARGAAMVGAGGVAGTSSVGTLNVYSSPLISTASQLEIERNLVPLIIEGLRKRGVKVG